MTITKATETNRDMQPFPVVKGDYLFWIEPAPEGGYSVSCQNVPGVNAQGETFEEAIADAMKCVAFELECREDIAREEASKRRAAAPGKTAGRHPRRCITHDEEDGDKVRAGTAKAPTKAVVRSRKRK